jgi:hypothetical protein
MPVIISAFVLACAFDVLKIIVRVPDQSKAKEGGITGYL